jgi:hypothetical protein
LKFESEIQPAAKTRRSGPQRLQALEGQALGVADPGEIEPADEGGGRLAVAIGQRNDGINGYTLGVHVVFLDVFLGLGAAASSPGRAAYRPPVNPALTVSATSPIRAGSRIRKTTHGAIGRKRAGQKKPRDRHEYCITPSSTLP